MMPIFGSFQISFRYGEHTRTHQKALPALHLAALPQGVGDERLTSLLDG